MKKWSKRRPPRTPRPIKKTPAELPGFVTVSAARFTAVVNAHGARPVLAGPFDPVNGVRTNWVSPTGQVIAATVGGTIISHLRHMLAAGLDERMEAGDSIQGEQQ